MEKLKHTIFSFDIEYDIRWNSKTIIETPIFKCGAVLVELVSMEFEWSCGEKMFNNVLLKKKRFTRRTA